jgi:hypothetical protein
MSNDNLRAVRRKCLLTNLDKVPRLPNKTTITFSHHSQYPATLEDIAYGILVYSTISIMICSMCMLCTSVCACIYTCKTNNAQNFYFGVLHPVARTLLRLLEEPSPATTLQGVYFIFYIFLPLHVWHLLAIFKWNT